MMPQMPGLPKSQDALAGESSSPSGDSANKVESPVLNAPLHQEDAFKKPVMESSEDKNNSQMKIPSAPKKGIEVVAVRKGFYNQIRRVEGDKFLIRSEEDFGDWMKCEDNLQEKRRVEFLKAKKAKK